MAWRIERTDTPSPMFLSQQLGRDFGQPAGAFTADVRMATIFITVDGASRALSHLGPASQLCALKEVLAQPLPPELGGFPSGYVADVSNRL